MEERAVSEIVFQILREMENSIYHRFSRLIGCCSQRPELEFSSPEQMFRYYRDELEGIGFNEEGGMAICRAMIARSNTSISDFEPDTPEYRAASRENSERAQESEAKDRAYTRSLEREASLTVAEKGRRAMFNARYGNLWGVIWK